MAAGVVGVGELVVEDGTTFHTGSMTTELEDQRMETSNMSGLSKSYPVFPVLVNSCIPISIAGKAATLAGGVLAKGRWSSSGEEKTGEATGRCRRGRRRRGRSRRCKTCGCSCKVVRGLWWIR